MASKTVVSPVTTLASAVATAGTFTVAYPTGYQRSDFVGGVNHRVAIAYSDSDGAGAWSYFDSTDDFVLSFGASSVTVTNKRSATIPAGYVAKIEFDIPYAVNADPNNIPRNDRVRVIAPGIAYLDLGNPVVSDDDYFIAAAALVAGAQTLLQTTLDWPRNVILFSDGNDTTKTATVTGLDEYGHVVIETIAFGNNATTAGKKAFKSITSISISANLAGTAAKIGFGEVLGLPIFVSSSAHILKEIENDAAATAGTFVGGLALTTQSTATTADVRGTYDPNSACDGSKSFGLLVVVDDLRFLGATQYDG